MKDIYSKIDELSEELHSRECLQKIKEVEKRMENDPEVISLYLAFEKVQREYSSSLNHYEEDAPELISLQKLLYEKKLKLDSHPLVEEYYSLLKEVNEPLRYLEMRLLSRFRINKGNCK